MKYVLGFLLTLVVGVACAEGRNLNAGDLKGLWRSGFPTTQGEVDELEFYADGRIRFLRTFKDATRQEFMSRSISRSGDLEIIELPDGSSVRYKLVLAGWLTSGTKKLFGTMFMYEPSGHLFNGLPVSFEQEVPEQRDGTPRAHHTNRSDSGIYYVQASLAFAHYTEYGTIVSELEKKCYDAALTNAREMQKLQVEILADNLRRTGNDPELLEYIRLRDPDLLKSVLSGDIPELRPYTTTCP